MKINQHRIVLYSIILLALIDIITRNNAQLYFNPGKTDWVIKGVLGLTYKINYGGILGIGKNWKYFKHLNLLIRILILIILPIYYLKLSYYLNLTLKSFFILHLASVIGGLPDLIFLGYNRDWIVWFGPGIANLGDYYSFASLFLLVAGLLLNQDLTWERFKKYCRSSLKE